MKNGHVGLRTAHDLLTEATRRFPPDDQKRHALTLTDSGKLRLSLMLGEQRCDVEIDEDGTSQSILDECEKQPQFIAACGAGSRSETSPLRGAVSEEGEDATGRFMVVALGNVVQRFRWVAPGKFTMGSPENEAGRWDDEQQDGRHAGDPGPVGGGHG